MVVYRLDQILFHCFVFLFLFMSTYDKFCLPESSGNNILLLLACYFHWRYSAIIALRRSLITISCKENGVKPIDLTK